MSQINPENTPSGVIRTWFYVLAVVIATSLVAALAVLVAGCGSSPAESGATQSSQPTSIPTATPSCTPDSNSNGELELHANHLKLGDVATTYFGDFVGDVASGASPNEADRKITIEIFTGADAGVSREVTCFLVSNGIPTGDIDIDPEYTPILVKQFPVSLLGKLSLFLPKGWADKLRGGQPDTNDASDNRGKFHADYVKLGDPYSNYFGGFVSDVIGGKSVDDADQNVEVDIIFDGGNNDKATITQFLVANGIPKREIDHNSGSKVISVDQFPVSLLGQLSRLSEVLQIWHPPEPL